MLLKDLSTGPLIRREGNSDPGIVVKPKFKTPVSITFQEGQRELRLPVPQYLQAATGTGGTDDAVAPMPGVVERVAVEEGATVKAGDPVVVMIAMKMEVSHLFICLLMHYSLSCHLLSDLPPLL